MNTRQAVLGSIGGLGAVTFAVFFALTVRTPEWLEAYASDFIEQEAARQLDERIDSLQPVSGDSALSRMAASLARQNEADIARHKAALKAQVHERMADALAEIRNLDCECRAKWAQWLKQGTENQILLLQQANAVVTDFIHASYAQVVEQLKRDVRVFTAANAAMFLLVLAIALAKPQASLQLFVPGLLLTAATVICSYFYIFEQNWLLTIIYNDYLGYAYLAYLGLVFGFLCDIALNHARVTTELVNAVLNALGSAATAAPC
jgi:hypothetical protein